MNHNKQSIEKNLKALEAAVKMEADIREVMEKMKHYKQVNSRFTDALKEKGYIAYICKDKYSTKLSVSYAHHDIDYNCRVGFTVYVSHIVEKRPITWELIEIDLKRHAFQGRLDTVFKQMKYFEVEKMHFEKFLNYVDKFEFKCFDLSEVKRDLREKLEYANKQ